MSYKPTAVVVVSHSRKIAEGIVEVAEQMAPEVYLRGVGGTDDGRIGTSFDALDAAVTDALNEESISAVVLTADLGSAVMTAESVVEFADGDVRLASGPVVEGTVAAAVQAQLGADPAGVAEAAATGADDAETVAIAPPSPVEGAPAQGGGAGSQDSGADSQDGGADSQDSGAGSQDSGAGSQDSGALSEELTLSNEQGLHARPAALLARTAAGYDASVQVNGVDASSIIALMGLNATKGDVVTVTSSGPQAAEAMEAVRDAINSGLGDA